MKQNESSWGELLQGRNGLRSLALAGGVAVHAVNVYIVTTILPSVVDDIGGLAYYAWNMTLFVVASIIGSALSPKMMDAMGLKRAYLCAIAAFSFGTVVCALAPSMPWLLAGRTAQGLGGGLLLGLSYSAVRLVFDERLWSRAMVLVSSMWGVATLAGPAIGGIFAQTGHWRLAFWAVLPIAGLLAVLVQTQLQPRARTARQRAQAPFRCIMLLALSVLVVSVASVPDSLAWNGGGLAAGLVLTIWIARLDSRAAIPLLPQGTYVSGAALASLYACIALLSIGVTTEVYIPYFLQIIHGKTPLVAGYWMALLSAGWTTGSFISSGRSTQVVNVLIRTGPVVSAASLALLAALMPLRVLSGGGSGLVNILMLPLFGVGLGVGLCWPNLLTRVFRSAPKGQENIASAGITTLQLYAMAMGAALAGMVANAAGLTNPGGVPGAQHAALALFAVFAGAPGLAIFMTQGARAVADRHAASPEGDAEAPPAPAGRGAS